MVRTEPSVHKVFEKYPVSARKKISYLRKLIIDTAKNTDEITSIEETLKWGEPSYNTKKGSPIRIDWKEKKPQEYAMYFNCQSALVPTFKMVFGEKFNFEGNRAIIFQMNDPIPEKELKICIRAALLYHKVKKLPTLGI